MIWILIIVYLWAGLGYASMIKSLRPLLPNKYAATDLQMAVSITILWPAVAFTFMFYDGDKSVSSDTKEKP